MTNSCQRGCNERKDSNGKVRKGTGWPLRCAQRSQCASSFQKDFTSLRFDFLMLEKAESFTCCFLLRNVTWQWVSPHRSWSGLLSPPLWKAGHSNCLRVSGGYYSRTLILPWETRFPVIYVRCSRCFTNIIKITDSVYIGIVLFYHSQRQKQVTHSL